MVKFIGKIIDSEVLLFQERAKLGEVSDVLVDPADGSFVGLEVLLPKNKIKYIPLPEIKGFGRGMVMIKGVESLSDRKDVVRIDKMLKNKVIIIGSKVVTEEGETVGKVTEATLNLKLSALERLYVRPPLSLKFLTDSLVIPAKNIVRIEEKKIIIKDTGKAKSKEKTAPCPAPTAD
jgi:sporulation protein YlmC with PRC-barrel domain